MIRDFQYSDTTKRATFKLGGTGYHRELQLLTDLVPRHNRSLNNGVWSVEYADQYAEIMRDSWFEFSELVDFFKGQLELW